MASLNRHLPWIQLALMIVGLAVIYGQQIQSVRDVERRTTQCEVNIHEQNISSKEVQNMINDIKGDIREIKTDMKYLRRVK